MMDGAPEPARSRVPGCVECGCNRQCHETGAQPAVVDRELLEGRHAHAEEHEGHRDAALPPREAFGHPVNPETGEAHGKNHGEPEHAHIGTERRLEGGLYPVHEGAGVGEKVAIRNFTLKDAVTTFEVDAFVDGRLEEVRGEEKDEERRKKEYGDSGYQSSAGAQCEVQFTMLLYCCAIKD